MGLDILICIDDVANELLTQSVSGVEVLERIDQNSTYQLNFMIDIQEGDIGQLLERDTHPGKIISILANVEDQLICLIKGPVLRQSIRLNHGGAGSTLHIEGEDTGYKMDLSTRFQVSSDVTDADIVTKLINDHDDMIADVEETPGSEYSEENHTHVQNDSDLRVIRTLAKRNGFHFWITHDENGMGTGHFKSRSLDGEPVANLIINHRENNIDSLQINADQRAPSQIVGKQMNLRNKEVFGEPITLQDSLLGTTGLSSLSETAQSVHLSPVVDQIGTLNTRGQAALRDAQWFIKANCHTSLHRLGKIIKYHTIVNMSGAGLRYDGKYYVTAVTHQINASAYSMDIELARNAWGNDGAGSEGISSNIF